MMARLPTVTREARAAKKSGADEGWLARLDSPTTTYHTLLMATIALVSIGLVMVLSASAVVSYANRGSSYSVFLSQLTFAILGGIVFVIASRLSVRTWRRLALPAMVGAIGLQLLVFSPLGIRVNGNRNWIDLGVATAQPSEAIKLGLVLFGAAVLSKKSKLLGQFRHVLIPYLVPFATVAIGLVLLGDDVGTVLVLGAIVAGVLWAAGVPARYFIMSGVVFVATAVTMVIYSPNRLGRFDVWLGRDTDPFGAARQSIQGRYALADGGWFGLGLGASREKWQYLSEPHNDFIFAIIGEELGLPGTLVVIGLFVVIALACFRLVTRSTDLFVRLATAGIMTWIVAQAMVNIGAVVGLLPVIGVPLPLVSSGGSSLVTTLLALGILLSFARAEPGCREALTARPSVLRRTMSVMARRGRGR